MTEVKQSFASDQDPFNQRLLNFNHYLASAADYIYFARYLYEQHHLRPSINFAMHKIKPGTLAVTVKNNFQETIERFAASHNAFSFMGSIKEPPACWKQFSFDVLDKVKQLGIPIYFLTLSCADEEL